MFRAIMYTEKKETRKGVTEMKKIPVITISRQYGSGGHDIGKLLAEKLGVPYYDNELIALASKDSGIPEAMFNGAEDTATTEFGFALKSIGTGGVYGMPLNNQLFMIQSSFIRTIADNGPAVIVGRCADYVLKNYCKTINIFIDGDFDARVKRTAEREKLTKEEAERAVARKDKSRATYYNFYTDQKWGDIKNYDIVLNSTTIGVEKAAELLAFFVTHSSEEA